jgi:hypothetical protein
VPQWGRLRALLVLTLLTPSCLRVIWSRSEFEVPIVEEDHAALSPGDCDLTRALQQLGAPLYVWDERGSDLALAWGWNSELEWGVNLSIPVAKQIGATLDYQTLKLDLHGLVLVFDANDLLIEKRIGLLNEIAEGGGRRRPALVEEQ